MLKTLKDFEKKAVIGSGGPTNVKCYDENGIATRGYHADSYSDFSWFCCSGDKGEYSWGVYGIKLLDCETNQGSIISAPIPDKLF